MAEPALIRAGLPPRPGAERSLRGLTGQGEVSYRRTGLPPYRLAGKCVEMRMRPGRLELPRVAPQDPKSCAYANSATVASVDKVTERTSFVLRPDAPLQRDVRNALDRKHVRGRTKIHWPERLV